MYTYTYARVHVNMLNHNQILVNPFWLIIHFLIFFFYSSSDF